MAVLIEGISVVVRVPAIEARFPGGLDGFARIVRNATYCADGELARAGFMTPDDTRAFVRQLEAAGLAHVVGDVAQDIVVVDQRQGPLSACRWVLFGHVFLDPAREQRVAICRATGSAEAAVALPGTWNFAQSLSKSHQFVPSGQLDESMRFVRSDIGVDVYEDRKTGKAAFVGRVTNPDEIEHDALYERAIALLGFTGRLVPPVRLSLVQKWRVHRGLRLMRKVLSIRPDNWAALWTLGKALQVSGDSTEALDAFSKAYSINPSHADVAREASISAMECGRHDAAQTFAEKAVQLRPDDAGLLANLALVSLLKHDLAAAREQVERAYLANPDDRITQAIRRVVTEVISGSRPRPNHVRDLMG